ncbi:hypothetical protein LUZ60_007912 [Juncus effusus]|nr:hypothetical protein LUZ60_007912 [Juncus effusus]
MSLGLRNESGFVRLTLRRCMLAMAVLILLFLMFGFYSYMAIAPGIVDSPRWNRIAGLSVQRESRHGAVSSLRKLLSQAPGPGPQPALHPSDVSTQRVGSDSCTKDDIVIYQGATSPLPNGIPTYTVQVLNVCTGKPDCTIGKIHLSCGWFSSARLVNPRVFRRLGFNNCLVYDGRGLPAGESVSFQYANSFPYQFSVTSASCVST